ncbi:hypothetical protein [Halobacillus litoralis]|uniref:hypothetical protein n=1 Tax=Halobacillus litoralis TaxID=45668 RepID=UPI003531EF59
MRLMKPLLGRHYYPHGIEYGHQEGFTDSIISKAKSLVSKVSEPAKKYHSQVPEHVVLDKLKKWAEENENEEVLKKVEELSTDSDRRI